MGDVLVTGGNGFIGERYIKLFGGMPLAKNVNINEPISKKHIGSASVIVHLAARTRGSHLSPQDYFETNVLGTINVLKAAEKYEVPVVFASSSAVYPDAKEPVKEDSPLGPRSIYGMTKGLAEAYIDSWKRRTEIPCAILRISNVYGGASQRDVIGIFIHALSQNKDVLIKGNSVRDYIYVDDVCAAIHFAIKQDGVFNISTGVGTTLSQIFDCIQERIPSKSIAQKEAFDFNEVAYSVLDPSRANASFGWAAETPIFLGVEKTIKQIFSKKD